VWPDLVDQASPGAGNPSTSNSQHPAQPRRFEAIGRDAIVAGSETTCDLVDRARSRNVEPAELDHLGVLVFAMLERAAKRQRLGYAHVADTYWYIEAVPELLQLATDRWMRGRAGAA
jgi:hypothetical protein